MKNTNVTRIRWFIKFFKSKPKKMWCEHELINDKGQRCALGFLCSRDRLDSDLMRILMYQVAAINNGYDPRYTQPHPKARILAALRDKLKEAKNE